MGEDTHSVQKASVTNFIFYAQFFNTGFLLLLVNANMNEHRPYELTKHIDGPFSDYVPEWYDDVGMQIVDMMKINAVMPIINLVVAIVTPKVMQKLDSSIGDVYKTKATSISAFKGIYGGGEYAIEEMYSETFNAIFITMLYGIGLPILFPLAALRLFLQWIC